MSLKSQAITSVGWKLLEKGGSQVVKLVVQMVMARVLAPDEFGALAIMLVFVTLGNVIVSSGLNTALIQDPDVTERDYSTVFWLCGGVSVALFVVVFAAAPAISSFYSMPEIIWPLRALDFILLINAYNSIQIAIITRELKMRKIFFGTIVSTAVSSVLGIGTALAGGGLWALIVQQLSYQLSNVIAHAAQMRWRPRLIFDIARARRLYAFGWKLLVSGLLNSLQSSLTSLVAGKQFCSYDLGLMSQGEKYPQALGSMLDGVIQPVMLSTISKVQDDVLYARRIMRRALKTSTYLVVPAMCFAAVAAPTLVPMLLGEQWTQCVPFFQMFCLSYALLPMHTTNLQALVGMGQSGLFLKLELAKTAVGVVGVFIAAFIIRNVYALTLVSLVASATSTFINAAPNRRVLGYTYLAQIRDVAPAMILTALGCTGAQAITLFPLSGAGLVAVQALAFIVVYLGVSAAISLEEFTYLVGEATNLLKSRHR